MQNRQGRSVKKVKNLGEKLSDRTDVVYQAYPLGVIREGVYQIIPHPTHLGDRASIVYLNVIPCHHSKTVW